MRFLSRYLQEKLASPILIFFFLGCINLFWLVKILKGKKTQITNAILHFFKNVSQVFRHFSQIVVYECVSRSSRSELFYKKGVLRNFAKFTGKDLCQSLLFNKVAGLRTPFLTEPLWWLLLYISLSFSPLNTLKVLTYTEHSRKALNSPPCEGNKIPNVPCYSTTIAIVIQYLEVKWSTQTENKIRAFDSISCSCSFIEWYL